MASLLNDRRAAQGLSLLNNNVALTSAAQQYAELHFQTTLAALSHTLDGTPADRALRQGYAAGVGEVLVLASPTAGLVVDIWLASPPHQSIVMGAGYAAAGIGCYVGPYTGANGFTFEMALCVADLGLA